MLYNNNVPYSVLQSTNVYHIISVIVQCYSTLNTATYVGTYRKIDSSSDFTFYKQTGAIAIIPVQYNAMY